MDGDVREARSGSRARRAVPLLTALLAFGLAACDVQVSTDTVADAMPAGRGSVEAGPSLTDRETSTVYLETPGGLAFAHGAYDVAYRELRREAPDNPRASYLLAELYREGRGVERNPLRAIQWYSRAADAGLVEAQLALGMLFAYDTELARNYNEAFLWFRRAAEQGHAEAQFHLGLMYANGMGTVKDPVRALAWLDTAAAQGMSEALEVRELVVASLNPEERARAAEIRTGMQDQ